jgi:glucan phosphoethanolaminetransferase (alkaline phosphatase superfamily)
MDSPETRHFPPKPGLPSGLGAAALLSAGIGSFALAVIAIASDRIAGFRALMTLYTPTGSLSGVTTMALVLWLIVWGLLHLRWRKRDVNLPLVSAAAIVLLVVAFFLMFPPIADLF